MRNSPLVSIVFLVYNHAKYLSTSLPSILNQTYPNLEILICDDASTDNSLSVLKQYTDPRIKLTIHNSNHGYIHSRNEMFDQATGDFIAIQDGDDWSELNRIKEQLAAFKNDPELSACGTNYFNAFNEMNYKKAVDIDENKILTTDSQEPLPIWNPTLMIRRKVYEEIGGLNTYFVNKLGDDNYWLYLIREKYKMIALKDPLYYYRKNPVSITKTFGSLEKHASKELVKKLKKLRKETGTDWLERKEFDLAKTYEQTFLKDKQWISKQYQSYAAMRAVFKDFKSSSKYLLKAFIEYPFRKQNFSTLFFIIRQYLNR